jgi:hypothetical protein
VPRGNTELFDLLSIAFRGRSGFTVILDRRAGDGPHGAERRGSGVELGPDDVVVAEQAVRVPQQSGQEPRRLPSDGRRAESAWRGKPPVRRRIRRQRPAVPDSVTSC